MGGGRWEFFSHLNSHNSFNFGGKYKNDCCEKRAKKWSAKKRKACPLLTEEKTVLTRVVKRDGRVVAFDEAKITKAVMKAFAETGEGAQKEAQKVSAKVVQLLNKNYKKGYVPEIEEIQDLVERVLMILILRKLPKPTSFIANSTEKFANRRKHSRKLSILSTNTFRKSTGK